MKPISNINDNHKVLAAWHDVKQAMLKVDDEFLKFYGPTKTKKAGIRARKRIMRIIKEMYIIREKLIKQREDYDSEY